MKRDMKLIAQLLIHLENLCEGDWIMPPAIPGYTDRQIQYHVELCHQAGFLEAQVMTGAEEAYSRYAIRNLTWSGHEHLAQNSPSV